MSNEPALKAIPDETPAAQAPAADARLHAEMAGILDAIAQARTAIEDARQRQNDAEQLLHAAESRARQMLDLIAPAADAEPAVAQPPAPVDEAHLRSVEEQAFLDALGLYDTAEPPELHHQDAEQERVPTVSGVVSQLGRGGGEPASPPQPDEANAVRMLEAMVEELAAAMPVEPRQQAEPPGPVPDRGPDEAVAEVPLTASVPDEDEPQPDAVAAPLELAEHRGAQPEETSKQTPLAAMAQENVQEIAQEIEQEIEPEIEQASVTESTLDEATSSPQPAEPVVEEQFVEAEPDGPEATALDATDRQHEAAEPEPPSDAELVSDAAPTADDSEAAPEEPVAPTAEQDSDQRGSATREPLIPENELLTSFAQMATRPFMPPEIGTAVIFEAPRQPPGVSTGTFEAYATDVHVTADRIVRAAIPATWQAVVQPAATATSDIVPQQESANDTDLDALLFGTPANAGTDTAPAPSPPWPDPVDEALPDAELPAPAAQPQHAWAVDIPIPASARAAPEGAGEHPPVPDVAGPGPAAPTPAVVRDGDPLAPLRAMSDEEKIALFE